MKTMTSDLKRSDDEIAAWNLRKINSQVWRFGQSLNEICVKARTKQLDVVTAGPILNNMMMTVDLLRLDANALLQPSKTHIHGKECKTEPRRSDENTLNTDFPDQSESFQFFPDSFPLKEAEGLRSSQTQTVQTQGDTTYNDLVKRLNKIEEIVVAQKVLKRLEKIEQDQKAENFQSKILAKRLEPIEKLKLPADLPGRIISLESVVCPSICDRVEKLENHVTEVKERMIGQDTQVSHMESCIIDQLSDLKETLDDGKIRLQAMEDKIGFRTDDVMLGLRAREVRAVEESQPLESKKSKKKDVTSSGKNAAESLALGRTSDQKCFAFQVYLDREGDWTEGAVMNRTDHVNYNHGDAFDVDSARFIAPVNGRYMFGLWIKRDSVAEETKVEVWRCRRDSYFGHLFYVCLLPGQFQNSFKTVKEMDAGECAVVRVFGALEVNFCMFEGGLTNFK